MDEWTPTAAVFDRLFATAGGNRRLTELVRSGFPDLPPWMETFDFVPAAGLVTLTAHLGLRPGDTLLDLACGLGGPGLFVSELTAARVVGVDWSRVAGRRALTVAAERGRPAGYVAAVGAVLPLRDRSVDGAICIDALGFIPGYGLDELRRVLVPGSRLGITAWERDVPSKLGDPVPDYPALLAAAGFRPLHVERPNGWLAMQQTVYDTARRWRDEGDDDPNVGQLAAEGEAYVAEGVAHRRVLVVAEWQG